jgi:hypothetical protein
MNNKFIYRRVGTIRNYYGGLYVATDGDKFYWMIEDYSNKPSYPKYYTEITEELYHCLIRNEGNHIYEDE